MSFPAYTSTKWSGQEWIGSIPSHWTIDPLFAVVRERNVKNTDEAESNLLSLSYGKIIRKDIHAREGLLPESFSTYQIVEPNDIIWRLTDLQNDKRSLRTAIVEERGIITSAYLRTKPEGINPDFLNYLLRAYDLTKVFYSLGSGLRQSMKFDDVRRLPAIIPPSSEQNAIVQFLDRETAKIDELIAAQEDLIRLLKEKRQAVISHAVTKGLDPNAPMKPSGIEWLGDIPAHWTLSPVKYHASILSGYAFPSSGFSRDAFDTRLLRGTNVDVGTTRWIDNVYWSRSDGDGLSGWELTEGDLVLGMDRPWISSGLRIAKISESDLPCLLLQRVRAIRPKAGAVSDFLMRLFQHNAFYHHCAPEMTGVSVPHISPSQVLNYTVPVPHHDEQLRIVDFLYGEETKYSSLIGEAEASISLLKERRAALISAAVTGNIDVRGEVELTEDEAIPA